MEEEIYMKVDFANLQLQYQAYKNEIDNNIKLVLNKSNYILGEEVQILEKELENEKSNLFKVYYGWFIAIDLYQDTYRANWLIDNPASINQAWALTTPMTQLWLKKAIELKEESGLSDENLRHFKLASSYIYWTYQNALRELLRGRKSIHVFTDLMNSVNFLDLPRKTHKKYLKRVADFIND